MDLSSAQPNDFGRRSPTDNASPDERDTAKPLISSGPALGLSRPEPTAAAAEAAALAWLVRLRWVALGGVLVATLIAPQLGLSGLSQPVLFAVIAAGAAYNTLFALFLPRLPKRARAPLVQTAFDFGALTATLWASGGVQNPFVSLFFVHVLLASALSGRRAALLACALALVCAAFLVLADTSDAVRISTYNPDPAALPLLGALAFATTLIGSAIVVERTTDELASRTREAEAARQESRRDAEILLAALDHIEAGVEVLSPDGTPIFRNRHILDRRGVSLDCPRDSLACKPQDGRCPVDEARAGRSGACRFSQRDHAGRERVIELLSFPLGDEHPGSVLRVHLDRTDQVVAERKLLFAERLASLGRAAQVVAHELNTPLATIQTLSQDIRAAIEGAAVPEALSHDLDESARVIHEETRRCRAITHDLLSGRDILAGEGSQSSCDVGTVLQRAAMIVFGTGASQKRLVIDATLTGRRALIRPSALIQVFVNLLQNAADAIDERPGARVYVCVEDGRGAHSRGTGEPTQFTVVIDDDGPGLAPGTRDRVMEVFFTTKPPGKGTGLGLYTSKALLEEAGGALALGDRPGGGARARVTLATEARG